MNPRSRNTNAARPLLALAVATICTTASAEGRTDITVYDNNKTLWVLGQVAKTTNGETGIEIDKTVYDPATALPTQFSHYNKLMQTVTYDALGNVATVSDGRDSASFDTTVQLGNWTAGMPGTITFPGNVVRSAVISKLGDIKSVTDETGAQTCYTYDLMGRVTSITYPDETSGACIADAPWTKTFAAFTPMTVSEYGIGPGHWRQVVYTGNNTKILYFDGLWRPLVEVAYDAALPNSVSQTVKRYDDDSHVVFQSVALRGLVDYQAVTQGTRTSYDGLGRTVRMEQDSELGVLVSTTQYLAGFQTLATNPRGLQTTTSYYTLDQPTYDAPKVIQHPEGAVTEITRDVLGKTTLLRRRNTAGSAWVDRSYVYDAQQRLCKSTEPEVASTVVDYDVMGNVISSSSGLTLSGGDCTSDRAAASASGRVASRSYDTRGRLSTLTFTDHRGDQVWTYHPDSLPNQVTTLNDGVLVTNAYTYNKRRLLSGESQLQSGLTYSLGYGYDALGNLSTLVQPGSEVLNFAPNALGQATQAVSTYGTYATGATYYANGALAQFTYGNGIVHTLSQNLRQLPDRSTDSYGGVAVLDDSYTYDYNGNVAAISDGLPGARGNRTMAYDGLDRLTSVASPMFGSASYAYDVFDNLTHVSIGGIKARDQYYCYDSAWRLTNIKTGSCSGVSVVGLGYDVQGNLQNKNGRTYSFDIGNRLRTVADGAMAVETYRYDAQGRRIQQTGGSGDILSVYGQDGVLRYVRDNKTGMVHNYVYLAGSLVGERESVISTMTHVLKFQHTDALGSPVAVTDAARNVIERSEYEPYGQLLNRPIKDGPGYTGHVMDSATGLIYMQQRYYDPTIGRFLSQDPVAADSATGTNFNRYWYANNSPYRFTDPDGRLTSPMGGQAAELGMYLREIVESGDHDKAVAALDAKHDRDLKMADMLIDYSAAGPVKDAVEVLAKLRKGDDPTAKGTGAVAGEVASEVTESILTKKIGGNGAAVVAAVVGQAVGSITEATVDSAGPSAPKPPSSAQPPPPPPPHRPNGDSRPDVIPGHRPGRE